MTIFLNKYFAAILLMAGIAQNIQAQNCSQEELEYLAQNAELLQELSQDCAFDCVFSGDQNQCVIDCLADQIEVSEACLACNAQQVSCVLDNCALACLFPNSDNCQNCIENNCMDDYFICIGDEDRDGFTVEGGDCDNDNPEINPQAEEIPGDGIDQNCDGEDFVVGVDEFLVDEISIINGQLQLPEGYSRVVVFGLDGREVQTSKDLRELDGGIYIIRVQASSGKMISFKFFQR